jgi:hypothetical protein
MGYFFHVAKIQASNLRLRFELRKKYSLSRAAIHRAETYFSIGIEFLHRILSTFLVRYEILGVFPLRLILV